MGMMKITREQIIELIDKLKPLEPAGYNLSKKDLSRLNLQGANLSKADLSETNLRGSNLSGSNRLIEYMVAKYKTISSQHT